VDPRAAEIHKSTPELYRPGSGFQTATEAAAIIAQLASIGPDGPTGTYLDAHGALPW
jgi:hypothetical protein